MTQLGTKKSRRGCRRCKGRRVKCNEEAPCSNCVRRGEECSLLEPSPSTSSEAPVESGLPSTSEEWLSDLALLHHYTVSTAVETRGLRPAVHALWRDYIPQQAAKHKFLMHGILALSALHLASTQPDQAPKYRRLCDKHQAIALAKYRSILASDIEMNSADALFAFASTISISSMARSCSPITMSEVHVIDIEAIVELFYLTRGVRDVIGLCYPHLKASPMSDMFHGHTHGPETVVTLPEAVAARFAALATMLQTADLETPAAQDCHAALRDLEDIYKNVVHFAAHSHVEVGQVWRWSTNVTPGFLLLVQGRVPAALVILAHFAAATMALADTWYTDNWGMYALHGIEREVVLEYAAWLEWPKAQAVRRMDILGVQKPPENDQRRPLIGF